MTWPKTYTPENAPQEVIALAEQLVPQLLVGDHPALEALRNQYDLGRIENVELTGVGFFVNYQVPDDAPLTRPANFEGGNALIKADDLEYGAGCVLFVRDGRLAFFEGYTYSGTWSEHTKVTAVEDVKPLNPPPD